VSRGVHGRAFQSRTRTRPRRKPSRTTASQRIVNMP
jgi:hypothetical protein